MVIMSFRFSKKKITFIVGLFLFAITAVLFGGKLIGTVQQTAAHSKIKSEKILGGDRRRKAKIYPVFWLGDYGGTFDSYGSKNSGGVRFNIRRV